jgi:hypothetical protein
MQIVIIRALYDDVIRRYMKGEYACAPISVVNHRSWWEELVVHSEDISKAALHS